MPPAEFEQKVQKLVKVNQESGLFECCVCAKMCKKRQSVVDHIKVCHLDGAEVQCKFFRPPSKPRAVLAITFTDVIVPTTNSLKSST